MSNETIRFEDWRKMIHWGAHRYCRRLYAAGAHSVQYDDVFSELCVAFCLARDSWRPDGGAKFSSYLARGMALHINRWLKGQIAHSRALSLDAVVADSDLTPCELVADPAVSIEETLGRRQTLEAFTSRLSGRARQYFQLVADPPPEVLAAARAINARTDYARQRGYARFAPRDSYSAVIFDLMAASAFERQQIKREIHGRIELFREAVHER